MKPLKFDDLFDETGQYGYYQLSMLLLGQYFCIWNCGSFISSFMMLGGYKPKYACLDDNITALTNGTNIVDTGDSCSILQQCENYSEASPYYSMYQEWKWACQPPYLITTAASVMPVLGIIGNTAAGHLADHFGRKWVIYAGLVVGIALTMAEVLAPSWQFYMALMPVESLLFPLYNDPRFALTMETVGKNHRIVQSFAFQWSLAYIINALIAYWTQHWRHHLGVVTLAFSPVLIIFLFVQESPRWLIQKKRYKSAAESLNRIAWWNGKGKTLHYTAADMESVDLGVEESKKRKYNFLHLFYTRQLTLYAVAQSATGICVILVAIIMLMNVQDLYGNPYIKVASYGALRLWTPVVIILVDRYQKFLGRRVLFLASQGCVFLCFSAICLIHITGLWEAWHLVGSIIGMFGYALDVGLVWVVYDQYTVELFPTVIRTIALSAFSVISVAGSFLGPQFILLKEAWSPAPYAAAAALSCVSFILGYCIYPETSGKALPDTLESVKAKYRVTYKVKEKVAEVIGVEKVGENKQEKIEKF